MDKNDLAKWVNEYTDDLVRWAYHKTSSVELAKDLVQETFLAAAQSIHSFKGESAPKTWLFSILNHKIIDYYRKDRKSLVSIDNQAFSIYFDEDGSWKKDKAPVEWTDDESELLSDNQFRNVLLKCLDALPEKWNECMKLKYLMGKNGEEICQDVGISATNFWQIIHRAKLQLRDCIDANWFRS